MSSRSLELAKLGIIAALGAGSQEQLHEAYRKLAYWLDVERRLNEPDEETDPDPALTRHVKSFSRPSGY